MLGFFKAILWLLLIACVAIVAVNVLHKVGAVDMSGMRQTVSEWSPAAADVLFIAVDDEQAATDDAQTDATDAGADALPAGTGDATESTDASGETDGTQDVIAPVAPTA